MKIVSVVRAYPTSRPGGMCFVAQDRSRELVRQGHEVHVLTASRNGKAEMLDDQGVVVHHCAGKPNAYTTEFATACVEFCGANPADILHLDSFDCHRPWWTEKLAKRTAITLHGFGWGAMLTKWTLWLNGRGPKPDVDWDRLRKEVDTLRKADAVIGISIHEYSMLASVYGLPNVHLVYNPIPDYFFDRPIVQLPATPLFLCAAVSGQKERGFDLAKRYVEEAGYELLTASNVPREKMPEVYDRCTAVVLPTFYQQGFDLTVAEAWARGRDVIVSAVGSYFFEDRVAARFNQNHHLSCDGGFIDLFPLNDAASLSSKISRAASRKITTFSKISRARSRKITNLQPKVFRPAEHVSNWMEAIQANEETRNRPW